MIHPSTTGSAATRRHSSRLFAVIAIALSLVLGSCGLSEDTQERQSHDYFGYAIDDYLITTNVATTVGASSHAQQLSGRLYPGVYVNGPKGQRIPNTDLAEFRALPGAQLQVEYRITDQAVYSDGQPITCDAFLLAFVAGTHRPIFDSYSPLMEQVDHVDCVPGEKLATVVFKEGYGERWRYLFSGGVLMPAHAIAQKLGMSLPDFNAALYSNDPERLIPIAQVWNTGFDLANFDPELQVSAGPFFIESVGERGEVTLARNDQYFGEKPELDKLVVWPKGTDLADLSTNGNLGVAEVDSIADTSWIDRNDSTNPYVIKPQAGVLSDQLVLANAGVFYERENRQAFAACVDQAAVAKASSKESGVEVDPIASRTVRAGDPINQYLKDISDPHLSVNIDEARRLEGQTVRIGYFAPDKRKAAMVEAIKQSCAPAGITVVDVSLEAAALGNLPQAFGTPGVDESFTEGNADAVLQAVDPYYCFPLIAGINADIEQIRNAEFAGWDEVATIPLSVQPRVFVMDRSVANVVENTDLYGVGWNMDRWVAEDQ